ncbi:MAG: tetratricopeptide repeat protein [Spirochaetia bacterium]
MLLFKPCPYVYWLFLFLFLNFSVTPQSFLQTELSFDLLSPEKRIIAYNDAAERLNIKSITEIYEFASQSLSLLQTYPDDEQSARTYYHLARVSFYLSRYNLALSDATIALNQTKKDKTRYLILTLMAEIYTKQENYTLALETYRKLSRFKETYSSKNLIDQSATARQLQYFTYAHRQASEAYTQLEKNDSIDKPLAGIELGKVLWALDEKNASMTLFYQAVKDAEKQQIPEYMALAYTSLSDALLSLDNHKESIFYAQKALLANRESAYSSLTSEIYRILYEGFLAINEPKQAISMLQFQYDSDLLILRNQQNLSEFFFDNSIKVQSLEAQVVSLINKNKKIRTTMIILITILIITLILAIFLISQIRHLQTRIEASIIAYNSIKAISRKGGK